MKLNSKTKIEKLFKDKDNNWYKAFEFTVFMIFMFLIYSIGGWIWELLYDFLKHGVIANHGVLQGPWLPIYGFGGVFLYIVLNRFKKNWVVVFMGSFVICTIIEYLTGLYLETVKHHKWWDYSNMPFNIDGRIFLLGSIFFGIMGLVGIYVFAPRIKELLYKFDFKKVTIFSLAVFCIFIIDFVYSGKHPNIVEKYKIIDTSIIGENKIFKR